MGGVKRNCTKTPKQLINMKKKWIVREKQILTRYWEFKVEAETEEEAKRLVRNAEVSEDDFWTTEDSIVIDEVDEIDE